MATATQPARIGLCRPCSRGRVVERSTEPIMRRWLEAFDDVAILEMARGVWNRRGGSVEHVREHRQRLNVTEP